MRRFLGILTILIMLLGGFIPLGSAGPVLPGEEEKTTVTEIYYEA